MDMTSITAAGSRYGAPSIPANGGIGDGSFQDMLKNEVGRQKAAASLENRTPSEAEAKITAAQIAAQANVYAPLKRGPQQVTIAQEQAPVVQATPGKFFPLHRAPTAPQGTTITPRTIAPTTVEALRASSKHTAVPANAVPPPAVQRPVAAPAAAAQSAQVAQPTAPWFNQAMQNLDKYDAMKANRGGQ